MTLKAVFIDVGNTLLYEKPSRFEIYAEGARRRGLDVSDTAMQQLMRRAHARVPREVGGAFRYSDGWFAAYLEFIFHEQLGLAKSELAALQQELFDRFASPTTFRLFPGAVELLGSLRGRGLRLGIISNWSTRLPGLLDRLDLTPYFDVVLCSAIERAEKPEVEIFDRALARAGVRAHEALHAGDDLDKDLRGARAAGLAAVLVDHAGVHAGNAPDGAHTVRDLYELDAWIATLA